MKKLSICNEKKLEKSIKIYEDFSRMMREAKESKGVITRIKDELIEKYELNSYVTLNRYLRMGKAKKYIEVKKSK